MQKGIEKKTAGINIPYWVDSVEPIAFSPLTKNEKTFVVVVGGGIVGVSIACNLSLDGIRVILIDDGNIGGGETGRTTSHLVNSLDDRYYTLIKQFGKEGARLAAKSHTEAIRFIYEFIQNHSIDCDFKWVPGYLFLHPSDQADSIEKEFEAAIEVGLEVKKLDHIPGIKNIKGPCIEFPLQAKFHPLKYLKAMCDLIIQSGSEIYTGTRITEVNKNNVVTADGNVIEADHIVIATNSPINNKFKVHLKQFPFRSYVIALAVKKDSIPDALYWDSGDFTADAQMPPYHYVRTHPWTETQDLLICGGEDHKVGLIEDDELPEEDRYAALEKWVRKYFDAGEIIYRWSGEILETMDGLAHIGRNPGNQPNMYIATGDSGNGMTHGVIASLIIPDLIKGKENEFTDLYDPSRLHLFSGAKRWIKEFLGGYIQYKKEIPDLDESDLIRIEKNEGNVITIEKKKYAVYRDENNDLHFLDAECTHLGCIVKWNNDEKSWDCPCHGSRFSFDGKVMNGPAVNHLPHKKIQI